MIKSLKIALFAGSFAFFVALCSPVQIAAQNPTDLLNRMDKHYKAVGSLRSNIKMDIHNVQLNEHELQVGTLILLPKQKKRQMYARIDWAKPRIESLAIIGDKFQMYVPASGQALTGKVNKGPKGVPKGAFDFLGMSRTELKANYTPEIAGTEKIEGGFETTHLVLTPKAAMDYKKADLWVDPNGMVQAWRG